MLMQLWKPDVELDGNKFKQLVSLLTNKDISLIIRGRLYSSYVQSSMLRQRKENEVSVQWAEMRMVR